MQSNQQKLKISQIQSYDLAKRIFWKHAKLRSQKELKPEFVLDDENRDAVTAFVAYFTGNAEEMEKYNIDPRKGILLMGNPGSGKSMLFRIMRDCSHSDTPVEFGERTLLEKNFFRRFNLYTTEHMAKLFMSKGEEALLPFGKNASTLINGDWINKDACFDDLGAEEIRNLYGNKKEVMVDIIHERYDHFIEHGLKTHFSTNLTADGKNSIEERYQSRIRSRLRHMCNVIKLGVNENYKDRR